MCYYYTTIYSSFQKDSNINVLLIRMDKEVITQGATEQHSQETAITQSQTLTLVTETTPTNEELKKINKAIYQKRRRQDPAFKEKERLRGEKRRESMTEEQKEKMHDYQAKYKAELKSQNSPEKKEEQNLKRRINAAKKREEMSED